MDLPGPVRDDERSATDQLGVMDPDCPARDEPAAGPSDEAGEVDGAFFFRVDAPEIAWNHPGTQLARRWRDHRQLDPGDGPGCETAQKFEMVPASADQKKPELAKKPTEGNHRAGADSPIPGFASPSASGREFTNSHPNRPLMQRWPLVTS